MAGMAEGTRLLTSDVDEIDGTFSKSEFLDFIGTKLHMSVSTPHKKFRVFWDEEDDESDSFETLPKVDPSVLPPSIVKDKIKIALQHVDLLYHVSILAQLWVPVMIGGRRFLKTSGQPFGLTYLRKGLCSYRKLCLNYYYCINSDSDAADVGMSGGGTGESVSITGPPSRVFVHGLPEYSPDVEFYLDLEYPFRFKAMGCKIKDYMAVPVFEPDSPECIGILELVSTAESTGEMDKPAYMFGLISTALQGVKLRTSNFNSDLDMENDLAKSSTGLSHALLEIGQALDEACQRHNLPFAQTWTTLSGKNQSDVGNVLSTTSNEYYLSRTRFSLLRDACESFHLLRGQGVVWKAFSSRNPCFCRDITKLSIAEYSFAHVVRKVLLDSSLAICLKSDHTGNDLYVLEIFLPFRSADPQNLLESVLLTMTKHLSSFRLPSGQKVGDEMHVEVLGVTKEDKLEFFRLFHTAGGSVELQGHGSSVHPQLFLDEPMDWNPRIWLDLVKGIINQEPLWSGTWDWATKDTCVSNSWLAVNDDLAGWREDSSDTRSGKEGSSYINSSASTSRFPGHDYLERLPEEDYDAIGLNTLSNCEVDSSVHKESRSSASELEVINREMVEKHFGMKLRDAALNLKVSPSTLKRKCRKLGIQAWPRNKYQSTCSTTSTESNKDREIPDAEFGQEIMHPDVTAGEGTTSSKHNDSQAAPITGSSFMIIKATFGEKIKIKFRLPFSSRLMDMEMEVASRLKLKVGNFQLWYLDEDDDCILITCDADLRTMESMGKTTVKVFVTHGTDPQHLSYFGSPQIF